MNELSTESRRNAPRRAPPPRNTMNPTTLRAASAEALGTGLLVATVVGSGIMAERLTEDMALALLANALPTAAMLVILITIFRDLSGAHFNPAVTLVMALRREIAGRTAVIYVLAQLAGAIAGTVLAHLMFDLSPLQLSDHVRSGPGQWLSEGVATFGLLLVILLGRRQHATLPALVGLYIGAAYWFTASTSFANPAVTVARALTQSFSGISASGVPGFIVAQLAGALLALLVASWLIPRASEVAS